MEKNKIGVIEVKGPNVFKGYWKMPDKTEKEFREDGYFITGDLGFIDDDGYISISGRDKDLIISGGLNVYPAEIENTLENYEPRVKLSEVNVEPNFDAHEFHVTLQYFIVGLDVPQQELTFALLPTR